MCAKCNPMRSGDSWNAFLAKYKLTGICDDDNGGWLVKSASGCEYHVKTQMKMDREGSYYFVNSCTCPARKPCRHIDAVMNMRHAEELAAAQSGDADGMEMLERTE